LDPSAALLHLNQAITLKPDFTSAYYARDVLLYKQNKPQAALADFLIAAKQEPGNAATLDQLGRTYLALDRPADALPVLREAAERNPQDPKTLTHLSRALSATGRPQRPASHRALPCVGLRPHRGNTEPRFCRFAGLAPPSSSTSATELA